MMLTDSTGGRAFWLRWLLGAASLLLSLLLPGGSWFWRQLVGAYRGLRLAMRFATRWGVEGDTHWATILADFERTKCELELRTALVERTLGLGVFAANPAGLWTWCSAHTAELLGRDTADCLGRLWLAAISDGDRERVAKEWRLCHEQGIPFDTHFAVTDDKDDPCVGMTAWEVKRDGALMGYIGQVMVWPGDDPPSWVVRARKRSHGNET